jgi:NADH dehydrogenase (ubiquinone) 1 alpha subcomplex subunit 5
MLARVATRVAARQLPQALFVRQKTTTGIVGLEVVPDAKPVLLGLYAKTLSMLEGVPAEAQYRKVVTDYTKARMAVLESTDDIPTIESKIDGGQVEQLIEQAKDELSLIPKLIAARAFDPYNGSPAEDILTDLKRCGPPAARLSQ